MGNVFIWIGPCSHSSLLFLGQYMTAVQNADLLYSTLGKDPVLGEIVEMFVEEMPQRADNFLELLSAEDWVALSRAAHQLKGAAGSHGFDQITPFAAELESASSHQQDLDRVPQLVESLVDVCRRVRAG